MLIVSVTGCDRQIRSNDPQTEQRRGDPAQRAQEEEQLRGHEQARARGEDVGERRAQGGGESGRETPRRRKRCEEAGPLPRARIRDWQRGGNQGVPGRQHSAEAGVDGEEPKPVRRSPTKCSG